MLLGRSKNKEFKLMVPLYRIVERAWFDSCCISRPSIRFLKGSEWLICLSSQMLTELPSPIIQWRPLSQMFLPSIMFFQICELVTLIWSLLATFFLIPYLLFRIWAHRDSLSFEYLHAKAALKEEFFHWDLYNPNPPSLFELVTLS